MKTIKLKELFILCFPLTNAVCFILVKKKKKLKKIKFAQVERNMSYEYTNYSLLILLKLLLYLILNSADLAASSSCQSECGGIVIPYPFGIGKDCYFEKSYEIKCLNTTTSRKPVPFLPVISKEVVSIFLPNEDMSRSFGSVRVRNPIRHAGCSVTGKDSGSVMNFTGTPFFIDNRNSLVAVGCNSKVSLTHLPQNMVGCELNCSTIRESYRYGIPFLDNTGCSSNLLSYNSLICAGNKPEEMGCDGNGCCQASLPSQPLQVLGIRIESNGGNSTTTDNCIVAFLTDEYYSLSNATKPKQLLAKGYSTISLAWVIQTKNNSFIDSLACVNRKDYFKPGFLDYNIKCMCDQSTISRISYANCECANGYIGNPYIFDKCEGQLMILSLYSCTLLCVCENKHLYSFTNNF